jgi:hypothetical protein
MQTDLLKIFLPSELLEHFTITNIEELPDKAGSLDIYIDIEENNQLPVGYSTSAYESKGFYNVNPTCKITNVTLLNSSPQNFNGVLQIFSF